MPTRSVRSSNTARSSARVGRPRPTRLRALAATAIPLAALLLAGCSGASTASPASGPANADTGSSGYPLTIDNCGTEVTLESAPERVVTIKSSTLELMLALGLEDRIVGSAFSDGPVPEELADAASGSRRALRQRAVAGGDARHSNPTSSSPAGNRTCRPRAPATADTLAKLGVASYVAPAACKGEGYMPNPLTFDEVFREFEEAGAIFGVPDAASELVAQQRAELDAIEPSADGLTALWYSSGDDTPYVGAGIGAPQMIMQAAGLENVAADVEDTWTSMGWEAIVEANPDVIVLVDAAWNTAQQKIELLESNAGDRSAARRAAAAVPRGRLPRDRGRRAQCRRGRVARRPVGGARLMSPRHPARRESARSENRKTRRRRSRNRRQRLGRAAAS